MLPLSLSASEEEAFKVALSDGRRQVRYQARLFAADGRPLSKELELLDGEVVVDITQVPDAPVRTAHVTVADPNRSLAIDNTDVSSSGLWFSMSLGLWWGIWIPAMDRWVDVPVFHGPIFQLSRSGSEIFIDAQGKEAQHIPPHNFHRSFSVRRHTKVHRAIRALMEYRGETRFSLDETARRIARDRTWHSKGSPWKAVVNLARAIDKQVFYDATGTLRLRSQPSRPSWAFVEGEEGLVVDVVEERTSMDRVRNAVVVMGERMAWRDVKTSTKLAAKASISDTEIEVASADKFQAGRKIEIGGEGGDPETRTIHSSYTTGTTIPLVRALDNKHAKGAKVTVAHRQRKSVPVVGRAKLTQNHPLSDEALTGGKRPRVRFEDRPNIHKKKSAEQRAQDVIERMKVGFYQELSISCVPVPHLEEGDTVKVDVAGYEGWLLLEKFTIPMTLGEPMVIGWQGRRVPVRRSRG